MRPPPPAELLLGRPEFAGDLARATEWVAGRRVLVTGAAGSVGTPLSKLLADAAPDRLVLLDHHEYSLFGLERLLGASSARYELADIGDGRRMARIFDEHRPEIVFHLAAAKHVQMQVWDALTGRLSIVDHHSVAALGDVHLVRNLGGRVQQMSQQRHV